MAKAFLMVRVQVADAALREGFDRWYQDDHLPWARKAFGAERAARFWSRSDPALHIALYQFSDLATARQATRPEVMTPLIADFDKTWPTITARTRDYLELVQELQP
ncbi:MAG: hypothetical protein HY060_20090 [Proteobacteria bacterium]|nr:hypothetical protein [Pseudomonadota bacterium]